MADEYGPFFDKPWVEAQWFKHAPVWAPSGVAGSRAASVSSGGLAFASSGLSVSAGAGKAWIRGAGFERTGTPPSHAVATNSHATLSRRDRLVLRRNLTSHLVETAVIQGTPSGTPTAPDLTQVEDGIWEEALFSFLVPPNNGTAITGVVDERAWITGIPWTDVSYASGYTAATDWPRLQARVAEGTRVELRGTADRSVGEISNGATVANLDVPYRPLTPKKFTCATSGDAIVNVVINTNGTIVTQNFQGSNMTNPPAWVSLDGIFYDVAS